MLSAQEVPEEFQARRDARSKSIAIASIEEPSARRFLPAMFCPFRILSMKKRWRKPRACSTGPGTFGRLPPRTREAAWRKNHDPHRVFLADGAPGGRASLYSRGKRVSLPYGPQDDRNADRDRPPSPHGNGTPGVAFLRNGVSAGHDGAGSRPDTGSCQLSRPAARRRKCRKRDRDDLRGCEIQYGGHYNEITAFSDRSFGGYNKTRSPERLPEGKQRKQVRTFGAPQQTPKRSKPCNR